MPRLFFGVEIPASVKKRLEQVKAPIEGAKWQSTNQLHLTLLFLGQVKPEQVPAICEAARNLPVPGFDLSIDGVGCFGKPELPHNLWADVDPVAPVAAIQKALNQRLEAEGFPMESRPFKPHVTLARFRKQRGSARELLASHRHDQFGQFPVHECVLYESTQGAGGSVYTVVERFPLSGSPGGERCSAGH